MQIGLRSLWLHMQETASKAKENETDFLKCGCLTKELCEKVTI